MRIARTKRLAATLAAIAASALFLALGPWHGGGVDGSTCSTSSGGEAPHPHRGKLKPFKRGKPESIKLGSSEEKLLESGQPWFSTSQSGNTGTGKAVVDVAAPPEIVWHQLLDFNTYPQKAPKVSTCKIYKRQKEGFGKEHIFVHFVSPVLPGYRFQYFCDHTYEKSKKSLTWCLDYDRLSDFEDVQGHWHVEPHPTKAEWSRVFYEVRLMVPKFLPKVIIKVLTTKAISDATTWVRVASEKEAAHSTKRHKRKEEVSA